MNAKIAPSDLTQRPPRSFHIRLGGSAAVEHPYPLEQFKKAFEHSLRSSRTGKVLFKFGASEAQHEKSFKPKTNPTKL